MIVLLTVQAKQSNPRVQQTHNKGKNKTSQRRSVQPDRDVSVSVWQEVHEEGLMNVLQ